jgi:competence protein ComEC
MKRLRWFLVLLNLALLAALVLGGGARPLEIVVLDVGQGQCQLILTPQKRAILIDGGGTPGEPEASLDVARARVAPTLRALGVNKVDGVICTHSDADHLGGLVYVCERFRVGKMFLAAPLGQGALERRLKSALRENGIPTQMISAGDVIRIGEMELDCLNPPPGEAVTVEKGYANDASAVFYLRYQGRSVLFSADIEKAAEERLAATWKPLAADVLIVPHHGSHTSSSARFLDVVRPQSAIISCGVRNPYGHPAPSVLDRYRQRGVRLYRTDYDGEIKIQIQEGRLWIKRP